MQVIYEILIKIAVKNNFTCKINVRTCARVLSYPQYHLKKGGGGGNFILNCSLDVSKYIPKVSSLIF